jgi:ribosomal protein S18 acetylase RimI-like enzyme
LDSGTRLGKSKGSNPKIRHKTGNETLLDQVEPLWHQLIKFMQQSSTYFQSYYKTMTFEKRKNALLKKKGKGEIHISIVLDELSGKNVGYCISSLNEDKIGEIDSLLVTKAYRGLGIGSSLVADGLAWMDKKGAIKKVVEVGQGNEEVFDFYGKFGFKPRKTILEQI